MEKPIDFPKANRVATAIFFCVYTIAAVLVYVNFTDSDMKSYSFRAGTLLMLSPFQDAWFGTLAECMLGAGLTGSTLIRVVILSRAMHLMVRRLPRVPAPFIPLSSSCMQLLLTRTRQHLQGPSRQRQRLGLATAPRVAGDQLFDHCDRGGAEPRAAECAPPRPHQRRLRHPGVPSASLRLLPSSALQTQKVQEDHQHAFRDRLCVFPHRVLRGWSWILPGYHDIPARAI